MPVSTAEPTSFGIEYELSAHKLQQAWEELRSNRVIDGSLNAIQMIGDVAHSLDERSRALRPPFVRGCGYNTWNCGRDHCGPEIRTPILSATREGLNLACEFPKGLVELFKTKDIINATDRNLPGGFTGLHVHVGIQGWTSREIIRMASLFWTFEPIIWRIFPNRIDSGWVASLRKNYTNLRVVNAYNHNTESIFCSSYYISNPAQNGAHLEIRYAWGSVDAVDIEQWVRFVLTMFYVARKNEFNVRNFMADENTSEDIKFLYLLKNWKTGFTWLDHWQARRKLVRWIINKVGVTRYPRLARYPNYDLGQLSYE